MKNFFIKKIENANVNNFTSDLGIKFRRKTYKIYKVLYRVALRVFYRKKIIVDRKVKLDKNKCYVFASSHSYFFEGPAIGATIDRNAYSLFGATEQLHHDIRAFFVWVTGLIYVNRFDDQSRKDSIEKMSRVLRAGTSIVLFPEGKKNDSENLLCLKFFAGPYNLSVLNNVEVVPISVYDDSSGKNIYITYGEPLKLYEYNKEDGIRILRDHIATMLYEQIEKYSVPLLRKDIKGDIHFAFMKERMKDYARSKTGSNPCLDNEFFKYKAGDVDLEEVWKDIDKIKIDINNIDKFYGVFEDLRRIKKYDFKNYIKDNYKIT